MELFSGSQVSRGQGLEEVGVLASKKEGYFYKRRDCLNERKSTSVMKTERMTKFTNSSWGTQKKIPAVPHTSPG